MLPVRRAPFSPWAPLRSTAAEPLCISSMGARAVGFLLLANALSGECERLACHRNTEHQEFHEMAPRREIILVCVRVHDNALCIPL